MITTSNDILVLISTMRCQADVGLDGQADFSREIRERREMGWGIIEREGAVGKEGAKGEVRDAEGEEEVGGH